MDTLDSRSLRYVDCYFQKFGTPGRFRYHIVQAAGAWLPVQGEAMTIEVRDRKERGRNGGKSEQHNVSVRREGKGYVAQPRHLEIDVGDVVLWNTADAQAQGFVVSGEGERGSFNSAALSAEAVYTHAFGTTGEFRWVDANNRRVSGVVRVRPLERADKGGFQEWMATLKKGAIITITGDRATPEVVEIVVGQTVFWAVEKADGISITDARLVEGKPGGRGEEGPAQMGA